eukprot:363133-Chlamydomonas_euryale.AAC.12
MSTHAVMPRASNARTSQDPLRLCQNSYVGSLCGDPRLAQHRSKHCSRGRPPLSMLRLAGASPAPYRPHLLRLGSHSLGAPGGAAREGRPRSSLPGRGTHSSCGRPPNRTF